MLRDPIQEGLARGWQVIDAASLDQGQDYEADVCIVGTGAGGGVSAEMLTKAGLKVILVEEGPLKSSRDFRMKEADAYPQLYQESAARKTRDKSINILQGRCVGGSTTVNWTSSFRTPETTLAHWRTKQGLAAYTASALRPWFEAMEARLSIAPWQVPPNRNNALLSSGAGKLGFPWAAIRRNVSGCWNIGYCGMGCPTNAKQSMLVTAIPAALDAGATLLVNAQAVRLVRPDAARGRATAHLEVAPRPGASAAGPRHRVRARHFVLAAGAIGSPALLLRSEAPDPHSVLGRRTFLHPTVISAALMADPVNAHAGAPQTIFSDHYLDTLPIDGPMGFKLEAPPLHPVIFATTMAGYGEQHAALMREFNHTHVQLALLRDGFHADSPGGRVMLRDDGSPVLDYPLSDFVFDGVRRAYLAMAEIQFAAGAKRVLPIHEHAAMYTSWQQARQGIGELSLKPLSTRIVSAHVMGGCAMSSDPRQGVVDGAGRHHQWGDVSVLDGSLFPTSIGANPQLSIYAIVARLASALASELTGKKPPATI
ncbi:MAG: GMC family oxidoreductase [Betaproteobacteria bacterium]|nr:GMC family oxidoreductase [Betaproteobacteria bacterium]